MATAVTPDTPAAEIAAKKVVEVGRFDSREMTAVTVGQVGT